MKVEEIEKRWADKEWMPMNPHADVRSLVTRIRKLEEGIKELIAYGMPKHIEEGLQKLLEDE